MSISEEDIFKELPPIVELEDSQVASHIPLQFFKSELQNINKKLRIEDLKKLDLNDQQNIALINKSLKYSAAFKEGKFQGSTYASTGKTTLRTEFPKNWAAAKILGFQVGQSQYTQRHQPTNEEQEAAQGRKAASEDLAKHRIAKTKKPSKWLKPKWEAYKNYVKENKSKFDAIKLRQQKAAEISNQQVKQHYTNGDKKRKSDQISRNSFEFFNQKNSAVSWEVVNRDGLKLTLRSVG